MAPGFRSLPGLLRPFANVWEREFGRSDAPNVEFHVFKGDDEIVVHNPSEMPSEGL
jgi:hypothetical protein